MLHVEAPGQGFLVRANACDANGAHGRAAAVLFRVPTPSMCISIHCDSHLERALLGQRVVGGQGRDMVGAAALQACDGQHVRRHLVPPPRQDLELHSR